MRYGIVVHPVDVGETEALATAAEQAQFTWLGVGDSPLLYQEAFLHQMAVLRSTNRLLCGPFVTHFVARHPVAVASALSTLEAIAPGRVRVVAGSGNSAARGLGLKPSSRATLKEAFGLVRAVWNGEGGTWKGASVPATGRRSGASPPLFLAGDGPRMAALSAEIADGYVYSGPSGRSLPEWLASAASPRWLALTATTAENREAARVELGPMIAAMANRALRSEESKALIPTALHADLGRLRNDYDYGYHADVSRPRNSAYMSDSLWHCLLDELAIWGPPRNWANRIGALSCAFEGLMLVLPPGTSPTKVTLLGQRLREVMSR